MARLVRAIHVFGLVMKKDVDDPHKAGHDGQVVCGTDITDQHLDAMKKGLRRGPLTVTFAGCDQWASAQTLRIAK